MTVTYNKDDPRLMVHPHKVSGALLYKTINSMGRNAGKVKVNVYYHILSSSYGRVKEYIINGRD